MRKTLFKLSLAVLMLLANLSIYAQGEQYPLQNLQSSITASENGEYILALVPAVSVDQYLAETKASWKKTGYTEQQIAQKENDLLPLIEQERESRRRFGQSGLYEKDGGTALQKFNDVPKEIDTFYVADDGSYVIGLNTDLPIFGLNPDSSTEDLLAVNMRQMGVYTRFFNQLRVKDSLSIDLSTLDIERSINRTTHSLSWVNREATHLDNKHKILVITKYNGEIIKWDVEKSRIMRKEEENLILRVEVVKVPKSSFDDVDEKYLMENSFIFLTYKVLRVCQGDYYEYEIKVAHGVMSSRKLRVGDQVALEITPTRKFRENAEALRLFGVISSEDSIADYVIAGFLKSDDCPSTDSN